MNEQNLIPFNARSPEDLKRITSMGGKASGAARRAKREAVNAEKVRMMAERELNLEEIRELRLAMREARLSAKAERDRERIPSMPQMARMPSRIPRGFWSDL